jgi:hypothetical protein
MIWWFLLLLYGLVDHPMTSSELKVSWLLARMWWNFKSVVMVCAAEAEWLDWQLCSWVQLYLSALVTQAFTHVPNILILQNCFRLSDSSTTLYRRQHELQRHSVSSIIGNLSIGWWFWWCAGVASSSTPVAFFCVFLFAGGQDNHCLELFHWILLFSLFCTALLGSLSPLYVSLSLSLVP